MDEFLDSSKVPKFNQEVINNLNRPIRRKETKIVIKSLWTKSGSHGFTAEFYQNFKDL